MEIKNTVPNKDNIFLNLVKVLKNKKIPYKLYKK